MTVDPHDPHTEDAPRSDAPPPGDVPPEAAADELADEVIEDLTFLADDPPGIGADPFEPVVDEEEAREAIGRLRADATERGEKADAARSFWRELTILIIVALVVAVLIKTFLVQAFYIPSGSMEDTLQVGDRVMVNKLSYTFGSPQRGDVIVFENPNGQRGSESLLGALIRHGGESLGVSSPDTALIKRVVAVGGETIEIVDNQVLIDGEPIDEPYIAPDPRMRNEAPIVVPEGHVFVMGDNRTRGGSSDSRDFGTISEDTIIGRAFVIVWPPGDWGGL